MKIDRTFDETVQIIPHGTSVQSTMHNAPKVLHWFEWGKRKLFLYHIDKAKLEVIELVINFKIPSFSRSIITPKGKIFLMGGEEPELVPKQESYMFDLKHRQSNHTLKKMVILIFQIFCWRYFMTSRSGVSSSGYVRSEFQLLEIIFIQNVT